MKIKIVLLIVIIFAISGFVSAQEPNEGDIQVWNETKVYFLPYEKADKNGKKETVLAPHLIGALRIGQDVKHFVSERVGFGVDIKLNKYFQFTPSYLYVAEQATKNKKAFEHRLRFDLTASKKWTNFGFSNRNRVERRLKNNSSDSTRYRNKSKLTYVVRNDKEQEIVTPFVSTEPYYDFAKKEWSRNEFSVGVGKKINKNLSGEFFYLLQNNTGNTLKRVNAFGVNLKIKLD